MAQDFPTSGTPPMIGVCLSIEAWHDYVAAYDFGPLAPSKVVLHHTWRPTESQWRGLDSMRSMQASYARKGWTAAPHLYVAPDGIWLFTPLREIGIHANAGNGSLAAGWYSLGIEMVGDYDQVRPSGVIWEATQAVIGGLSRRLKIPPRQLLAFHRDYSTKSCPGWAVPKDWVITEVDGWLMTHPTLAPTAPYTDQSPLLATVPEAHDAFVAAVQRRCAGTRAYDVTDLHLIASHYWLQATALGLDPWLAMAQCLHETANLSSWWAARPRRNPAGIGVTGQTRLGQPGDPMPAPTWAYDDADRLWRHGLSFRGWLSDSIPAHLGRLLAYATPPATRTPAQQRAVTTALSYRPLPPPVHGSAPILQALGQVHNPSGHGWASPGTDYGARIAAMANRLRGGT